MGRIPKVGESLEWEGLRLTVLEANKRRVERMRLESQTKRKTAGAN